MTNVGAPNSLMRRLHDIPEPTDSRVTRYDVHTSTPWGVAQTAVSFGRGIVQYSTAGHGGFHVSDSLFKTMPACVQTADPYVPARRKTL
jgi:hypothetical protein